ncbi:uncharacterized protein LOC125231312 [Leguminivora glycinivorella]|uniref:uncharacterized protein LOC125231312 n=1 Tax=Leguminivora glycinivorella TaxID=1035111 RepID=UPI00200E62B1|nr:uncharacterized protein LOC125231312 [Leguminivora glycinivorella]
MGHLFMLYVLFLIFFSVSSSPSGYGPFQLHLTKFDACPGPKIKNCTYLDPSGTEIETGILVTKVTVLENTTPSKGKLLVLSNGKELLRLQMTNPCKHLFLRPLLEKMFKVSKNCLILKGNYTIKLNVEEMVESYFGGKFFYGNGKIVSLAPNGEELARYHMNTPCEHHFLRPMLTTLFNATKNCEILKNDYSMKIDVGRMANDYFGAQF